MKQKTVGKSGSIEGVGLHTGRKARVFVEPAEPNKGLRFFRDGIRVEGIFSSARCTAIGRKSLSLATVEHLLSALTGLGVTNADIGVTGPEIPILDGSAADWVQFLKKLGVIDQPAPLAVHRIAEPIFCHDEKAALAVYPADDLRVSYALNCRHPLLADQKVDFLMDAGVYEREIAPARTFCTEEEAQVLKKKGFGRGADFKNTLVIGAKGPLQNRFRFVDECARHKVLDLLGDLALAGFAVKGHVVGLRSGHALNHELVKKIIYQSMTTKRAYNEK